MREAPSRFNSAAEFVDGRSLVTPECLERLVANPAAAKFPEEDGDVALHLFFQRYVRAQPTLRWASAGWASGSSSASVWPEGQ